MATYTNVTFQVNDDHLTRFIDGIAGHFGYQATDIDGEPNTETKAQYGKRKIRQQMILWVKRHELQVAREALTAGNIDITE